MKATLALLSAIAAFLPGLLCAQKAGESVTPAALAKLDWIRGEAPAEWEPGKVYVLECWATWCAPCVAAIPHVDDLHDRYHDRGLRVIGVNVWENGRDKVAAFVERKGEGMSYPVAYTGKGGAFETEWLKPGGVTGIPAAFVVKEGRVLVKTHPSRLTDALIEALLEGGDTEEQALDSLAQAERRQASARAASIALHQAMGAKDRDRIKARLAELEKADPDGRGLPSMRIMAQIACAEWDDAREGYGKLSDDRSRQTLAFNLLMFDKRTEGMPAGFLGEVADDYEKSLAGTPGISGWVKLAGVRWDIGQKDRALAAAKAALAVVEGQEGATRGQWSEALCRKLVGSLEQGRMPDAATLREWRESEAAE